MASPISALPVMNFPILTPEQMSGHGNLLQNALASFRDITQSAYLPAEKKEALQKAILENMRNKPYAEMAPQFANAELALAKLQPGYLNAQTNRINTMTPLEAMQMRIANQYAPRINESQLNFQSAQTNKMNTMTPLEAEALKIANRFAPQQAQADINYKNMGGAGMGAGGKEELLFRNLIAKDNPNLSPDQVYEASNAIRSGNLQLRDGTPINQLSPAAMASLDRITKYGTTSPILTGNIRANQAEAEIEELSKHAQAGLKPYGTTYLGKSPAQIVDSFKSDKESQKRLGRFIASQQLQFEITQNEIRLARGQPGVTTTQELMDLGQQRIKADYPKLSGEAREEAQRYFIEGLKKAQAATKKIPIGASQTQKPNPNEVFGNKKSSSNKDNDPLGIR